MLFCLRFENGGQKSFMEREFGVFFDFLSPSIRDFRSIVGCKIRYEVGDGANTIRTQI